MKIRKFSRIILASAGIVTLAGLGFVTWYMWASADVAAAYSAKLIASGVFVAGRTPESVATQELGFLPHLKYEVDTGAQTVTAWVSPRHKMTAVFREGLGAAVAVDGNIAALKAQARPVLMPDNTHLAAQPWPVGDAPSGRPVPADVDKARLGAIVEGMFAEPNPLHKRRTRAVVVVYDGEIVAERYGSGFDEQQRFPAWSMSKSILHALYGIAVRQGKVSIHDPAPVPAWRKADDPRGAITIDMLLRMSSGLRYTEYDFIPPVDLCTMLFLRPSASDFAMSAPLAVRPDSRWAYSSATANILSAILRRAYGDDAYYALPYRELFGKIGMRSAVVEADASGTYVFSSFLHATARDFARFGLLYAQDGIWLGERLLPEGWVQYAHTPTPTARHHEYGAHWWLASEHERARARVRGVTLPEDTFYAEGFEGQRIFVIPSRRLVVVRLGLAYFAAHPAYDYLCDILQALPER